MKLVDSFPVPMHLLFKESRQETMPWGGLQGMLRVRPSRDAKRSHQILLRIGGAGNNSATRF